MFSKRIPTHLVIHACWQSALGIWMILHVNQGAAAKGMHPCIWKLQMHNIDSLTNILHISRTTVQHAIIAVKKVISQVIVILKRKTIIFLDLYSPSINHNHHCITSIRPQGDHKVLVAHPPHVGVTITILVFWITSMHPHHHSLQYLHHSICICLQQVPRGVHLHYTLDQKTDYGNPCD